MPKQKASIAKNTKLEQKAEQAKKILELYEVGKSYREIALEVFGDEKKKSKVQYYIEQAKRD